MEERGEVVKEQTDNTPMIFFGKEYDKLTPESVQHFTNVHCAGFYNHVMEVEEMYKKLLTAERRRVVELTAQLSEIRRRKRKPKSSKRKKGAKK